MDPKMKLAYERSLVIHKEKKSLTERVDVYEVMTSALERGQIVIQFWPTNRGGFVTGYTKIEDAAEFDTLFNALPNPQPEEGG